MFGAYQLLSITSAANFCSMCVHRSIQNLEIYNIISGPVNISEARCILGRAIVGSPSNAHLGGSKFGVYQFPSITFVC